ncbi:hypothetical protein LL035_09255 [Lactobacillus delbrueckii subsp. lactis]|nr:hypothetical protein LL035_09255 [Lactobacillus delbrueckii subsp. lactis]
MVRWTTGIYQIFEEVIQRNSVHKAVYQTNQMILWDGALQSYCQLAPICVIIFIHHRSLCSMILFSLIVT